MTCNGNKKLITQFLFARERKLFRVLFSLKTDLPPFIQINKKIGISPWLRKC